MVRDNIGPIASFRLAVAVKGLPRTRSGKTCRKSISDMARNKDVKVTLGVLHYLKEKSSLVNLFSLQNFTESLQLLVHFFR